MLWSAWQLWQFRNALVETVKTVDGWTQACEDGLQVSTPSIELALRSVDMTHQQYRLLKAKVERIRKLLSVLSRGVSFLGNRFSISKKSKSNKLLRSNKQNGKQRR